MNDMTGSFPVEGGVAANFRLLQDVDVKLTVEIGSTQLSLRELLSGNQQVIPESRYIDIAPRSITAANVDTYWEELKRLKGQ